MRIQGLYDIDLDIKVNNLQEVTSPQMYISTNQYNPRGLFSEDIFGQTEEEQKYRCGYIKLPIHVFNPDVAKTIIQRSGGIIRKLAYAEIRCDLENGILIEKEDGKYCGLKDLYEIWEQINIPATLHTKRDQNIKILTKTPKRLLFNDKVLVLCGTKNGYLQKNLLAKNTVGTVRNVISAPSYQGEKCEVGIFRTGYPLMSIVSMFKPFVKFHMKQFMSYDNLISFHTNPDEIKRSDIDNIYDDKEIDDLIKIFMLNPGSRYRKLYMDPESTKPIMFNAINMKTNEPIARPLTLTDVIYICCYMSTTAADRHVYTVRYPIGDLYGAFFTKVHVLSTIKTYPVQFNNITFEYYPSIDPEMSHAMVSTQFVDVVRMSNSRLVNLGGDYDGDTIKSTGVWSDEANKQAEEMMYSKIYCVRTDLTAAFPIEKECLNGLYGLTKMTS